MKLGDLVVDCPHCGRALPPIPVDLSPGDTPVVNGALEVHLSPRIDGPVSRTVRLTHPWCFGGKDDGPTQTGEGVRYLNALRAS